MNNKERLDRADALIRNGWRMNYKRKFFKLSWKNKTLEQAEELDASGEEPEDDKAVEDAPVEDAPIPSVQPRPIETPIEE